MYRIIRNDVSGTGITTHADDKSSRVELGNKVFINVNATSNTVASKNNLSQRNNDYMKFSWDPMQVVNISRQQKAVCTRDQRRLVHLERHYSRQSHLQEYKQTTLIDKFRQKLVRLNKLRMPTEDRLHTETRSFPIHNSTVYRNIGTTSIIYNENSRIKSGEKSNYLNSTLQRLKSNKTQTLVNKGYTNRSVNNTNRGYNNYIGSEAKHLSRVSHLPTIRRPGDIESEIKQRQNLDYTSFRGYHRLDKCLNSYGTWARDLNKVDNNRSKNVNIDNANSSPTGVNCSSVIHKSKEPKYNLDNKKSVRFSDTLDKVE